LGNSFFVSDLHGQVERYRRLIARIREERPEALFLGGDLLPHLSRTWESLAHDKDDFVEGFLVPQFRSLKEAVGSAYPDVFLILGNDDPRILEAPVASEQNRDLWNYMHNRTQSWRGFAVYGYACVPPTPFRLKDWERYDVSRFVDPGCIPPEKGFCTVPIPERERRLGTIQQDLERLVPDGPLDRAIFLFHTPPYGTALDRAALDDMRVDHAPLDVHVGSIAVKRFIESRQPLLTFHGHIHESARLTGVWREQIGRTHAFSGAHDGPELALVVFSPGDPAGAVRRLI
jgi:Icc-related predicted phosphoesterase